jgi:hypothetical protein
MMTWLPWRRHGGSRGAVTSGPALVDVRPVRCLEWRAVDNERLELLVPRFRSGLLGRWLQPRLRAERSHIRISLEERGSWVWLHCDGERTVSDLASGFREAFPADAERSEERVGAFVLQMARNGFVQLRAPGRRD